MNLEFLLITCKLVIEQVKQLLKKGSADTSKTKHATAKLPEKEGGTLTKEEVKIETVSESSNMWGDTFATPYSEERDGRRFPVLEARKKSEECNTPYEHRTPGIDMVSEILGRNASPSFPSILRVC